MEAVHESDEFQVPEIEFENDDNLKSFKHEFHAEKAVNSIHFPEDRGGNMDYNAMEKSYGGNYQMNTGSYNTFS